jgi:hypothetical protein
VAFAVWASSPWRAELRDAIGPVMAWAIPVFLAYVPAVLIGFMVFTLITLRYRVPTLDTPSGPWPRGEWPPVTLVVAARNEGPPSGRHWSGSRTSPTAGRSRRSSPTTTRPTAPPKSPRRPRGDGG